MKKTANYDLNQWEKSDRILMDDFNADNANIESALDGKIEKVLLRDVSFDDETKGLNGIEFDLSDVDLTRWALLIFSAEAKTDADFTIIVNGKGGTPEDLIGGKLYSGCGLAFIPRGGQAVTLLPCGRAMGGAPYAFTFGAGFFRGKPEYANGRINTLLYNAMGASTIFPGARFSIWGVR